MEPYESVTFLPQEAQFVANTMFAWSQNRAVGSETDQGAVVPITKSERQKALDIVKKVNTQIQNANSGPISFTQAEAQMMIYLYTKYLQGHGRPQGDLYPTYWITFDTSAQALIINVLGKLGCNTGIYPSNRWPFGGAKPSYND
jgi:hypothetical protein